MARTKTNTRNDTKLLQHHVLKRCSKIEYCKQGRHVMFKDTMTKWSVQKQTHGTAQKHAEDLDVTDIQNKLFLVFLKQSVND